MLRTGVVLDASGGALAKMLGPFRLGIGGPVASGRQFISWIHPDDLVALVLARSATSAGAGRSTGPRPRRSRTASSRRCSDGFSTGPRCSPFPALALRAMYGEMAQIVTTGARVVPAKALVLGYEFQHPELEEALRSALA